MIRPLACLFSVFALCFAAGCKGDPPKGAPIPADTLARDNPNAKAKAILDELQSLPEDERQGWVQRRSAELTVFQAVTDPQLKARYDAEIKPLLGTN